MTLVSYTEEKTKKSQLGNYQIENHEDKIEEQESENVDLEMIISDEKSNKEDEKEVSNTKQKSNKNNDTLIAMELNLQTVEELVVNNKENMILEGFSLKVNSFEIAYLKTVLSEIEGNIFFGFTADGVIHHLVAMFDFFCLHFIPSIT